MVGGRVFKHETGYANDHMKNNIHMTLYFNASQLLEVPISVPMSPEFQSAEL